MRARLADPNGRPIVMRSHYEAGDDSTKIAARIVDVRQDNNGNAVYRAELVDTQAGRDIAALISGDTPELKTVSIHGNWVGAVRSEKHEGESVETGDDLDIDFVDFTASPGVVGAVITQSTRESYRHGEIRESRLAVVTRNKKMRMQIGETMFRNVSNGDIAEAVRQAAETRRATIAKSAKTKGKADTYGGASTAAAVKRVDIEKKAAGKAVNSKGAKKDGKNKAKVGSESTGYAKGDRVWEKRGEVWAKAFSEAATAPKVSDDTPVMPIARRMTPNDAHMNDVALYMRKMGHSPSGSVSVADYVSALGAPHPVYGGTADYPTPIYGG